MGDFNIVFLYLRSWLGGIDISGELGVIIIGFM